MSLNLCVADYRHSSFGLLSYIEFREPHGAWGLRKGWEPASWGLRKGWEPASKRDWEQKGVVSLSPGM